jgi:sporulation protein YlmC with PRC-barrel domain
MEIPMNVDVICGTETCGSTTQLVINPINEKVTHLVVAGKDFPNIERMVPIKFIAETSSNWIKLNCTPTKLSAMEPFTETDFIDSGKVEIVLPFDEPYIFWPYGIYENVPMPLEKKHLPAGEVAIHRGSPVHAKDGKIGKVDEFLIDPKRDFITHLVLREGHLWGQKDVVISVEEIDRITDNGVYLKLDKKAVEALPAIAVKRKWK